MKNTKLLESFVRRLKNIGVNVQLVGNYPWIYLDSVNGKKVKEKFRANHGFTAFILKIDKVIWSDRREVFKKVREMLKNT